MENIEFQEVVGRDEIVYGEHGVFVGDMEEDLVGDGRVDGGAHAYEVPQ